MLQLDGHTDWVRDVSWNIDMNLIASGSEDKSMIIWKI